MRISEKLVTIKSLFGSSRSIVQGNTQCCRFIRDALFGVTPHIIEAGMLRDRSSNNILVSGFSTEMPGLVGLCQHQLIFVSLSPLGERQQKFSADFAERKLILLRNWITSPFSHKCDWVSCIRKESLPSVWKSAAAQKYFSTALIKCWWRVMTDPWSTDRFRNLWY